MAIILALIAAGCATAPDLTDVGSGVRSITPEQAKDCKFIRVVQYDDLILGLGKNPTTIRAIGENNLRNKVGAVGANAFVTTKNDSNWFMGTVSYQAEAYRCQY